MVSSAGGGGDSKIAGEKKVGKKQISNNKNKNNKKSTRDQDLISLPDSFKSIS